MSNGSKAVNLNDIHYEIKGVHRTLEDHGKKIDKLNESVFDGLTTSVKKLSEQLKEQRTFCQDVQEQKQAEEIQELREELKKAKNGIDRRQGWWKKMTTPQKITLVAIGLGVLLRPDVKTIFKAIVELFIGSEIGG